jgi:AAA domain/CHC2 zinc finger
MKLSFDQNRKYYEYRLDQKLNTHREQMVRCVFHGDKHASMSVNLEDGVWFCQSCKIGGNIYQFESKMFPSTSFDENWENIAKIAGLSAPPTKSGIKRGEHIATHMYYFADGRLAFEKLRYAPASPTEKKSFSFKMPLDNGKWAFRLEGLTNKPLYRLPEVVKSNIVMITEGELKADALAGIDWAAIAQKNGIIPIVSATCNFDGAMGWKDEYSIYMAGKKVLIFPDNDERGREHAEHVAASVHKYAVSVHIVELPDLEEHGDIVDYLKTHTVADLVGCLKNRRLWQPLKKDEAPRQPWLVSASHMVVNTNRLDWLVEGVVNAYSKGIFVANAKAGKSLTALDMAVALATNQKWCGCPTAGRQMRCAVISREDPSFITQKRTFDFARGRGILPRDLEDWLFFNTRDQSQTFYLENDADCETAIKWIKEKGVEFAIFDVLNLLHSANENSNTEMTAVMKRLTTIRDETNTTLALIHHTPHSDPKRARGAGAIESWWEWKVVVEPDSTDDAVKTMSFISKACRPHAQIQILIQEQDGGTILAPSKTFNQKQHQAKKTETAVSFPYNND